MYKSGGRCAPMWTTSYAEGARWWCHAATKKRKKVMAEAKIKWQKLKKEVETDSGWWGRITRRPTGKVQL